MADPKNGPGDSDREFPTDDVTLAMLEAACIPDPEDDRTHLLELLDGAEGELVETIDYGFHDREIEVRKSDGWTVTSCVLALVREIQHLRQEHAHREASDG